MLVYIGIDWSETKHDICFMNEAGAVVQRVTIPHTPDGLLQLETHRQKLGVPPAACGVALETAHNLVIDFLWAKGYTEVYVLPPNVVKKNRGRYRQSGARTDAYDAWVLADVLRTDHPRLQPWHPDTPLTQQMRAKVSLYLYLTRESTGLSNRLRAVLLRYYPVATQIFSTIRAEILLEFVQKYPSPQAAQALTLEQFRAFTAAQGYCRPQEVAARFERLQQAQPAADPVTVLAYQEEAVQLAALLQTVLAAKRQVLHALQRLFCQHPDHELFSSLPGVGALLGPALLVKFGDDRQRFPTPERLQALAGTCPVTDQSGKRRTVRFRLACDKDFRYLVQQWARASLKESEWAQTYWATLRPHCKSNSHAYRCLGNRWLAISWKLWQTKERYDETYHLQQRLKHSQPRA